MRGKKDDIELFHLYNIFPAKRLVELTGEIDENTTAITCRNLIALDYSDAAITILLNTPGGDWYNGMAIYDTIKNCKSHITIVGIGHVMSMGTVIMQAADERIISPNCRLMIHYGTDGYEGQSQNLVQAGHEAQYLQDKMTDIFYKKMIEKHPKYKKKSLEALLATDQYMTPEYFVRLGLADKVANSE